MLFGRVFSGALVAALGVASVAADPHHHHAPHRRHGQQCDAATGSVADLAVKLNAPLTQLNATLIVNGNVISNVDDQVVQFVKQTVGDVAGIVSSAVQTFKSTTEGGSVQNLNQGQLAQVVATVVSTTSTFLAPVVKIAGQVDGIEDTLKGIDADLSSIVSLAAGLGEEVGKAVTGLLNHLGLNTIASDVESLLGNVVGTVVQLVGGVAGVLTGLLDNTGLVDTLLQGLLGGGGPLGSLVGSVSGSQCSNQNDLLNVVTGVLDGPLGGLGLNL